MNSVGLIVAPCLGCSQDGVRAVPKAGLLKWKHYGPRTAAVDSDAVTETERAETHIASGRVPSPLDYKGGMILAERRPKISPVSVGGPTVGATTVQNGESSRRLPGSTGRSLEWSSLSESQDIHLHGESPRWLIRLSPSNSLSVTGRHRHCKDVVNDWPFVRGERRPSAKGRATRPVPWRAAHRARRHRARWRSRGR